MNKLLIISILLFGKCYSQELENLIIPPSYKKLIQTTGDLDKDGIDEIAIVYETISVDKDSFFTRELYICKTMDSKLKLWKKNTTVIFSNRDSYDDNDKIPKLKIANNTLIIEQTFHGSSRADDYYKNIFRFQYNDWYLIGATTVAQYNCLYENTFDINFSTKKVIAKFENQCCADVNDCDENEPDKKYSFEYPFKIILMDHFTPGETEITIPKTKTNFSY